MSQTPSSSELTFPFEVKRDKRLSDYSTFKMGGPARYFIEVTTIPQMQEVVRFCHVERVRYLVIGKGSNSLFDDRGFDGLVIANRIDFVEFRAPNQFYAGAGYSFSRLGTLTARQGWSGLEFASGIPGTVGGAVYMNAGANKSETKDVLSAVMFVDATGQLVTYSREELTFGYRHSPFQEMAGAIVAALFTVQTDAAARERQVQFIDYRRRTQPYNEPSVGCIFRNPAEGCPSAGALIEAAGLKGRAIGGAVVSPLHANFIVNGGGAKTEDVLHLIAQVQRDVLERTGVALECEARVIPYE